MRPIDADALMDEANSDGAYGYVDAKQISDAPTLEVVPVVRCRDCKYRQDNERRMKMGDMMTFPDSVEEFMEQYKMTDTEHVYSNGTEYVPIYRMKQWFEHCRNIDTV